VVNWADKTLSATTAIEQASTFAATLQRHTKPTLQANLCKEAASTKLQLRISIVQCNRTTG